jgi:hypothetical protein
MRYQSSDSSDFQVRAVAGTRAVLMAFDVKESARDGLRGFSLKCAVAGGQAKYLTGVKYFKALVPNPKPGDKYSTEQYPVQSFIWSDYEAQPDTEYHYTVEARYGAPGALQARYTQTFTIRTEKEDDGKHGVYFNRGAIASHMLFQQFQNKQVTDAMFNQVDAQGVISDPEVKWLSRGLAEACIGYINDTKAGEGLRVCAYEFTYPPILNALKKAAARGVDVKIVYHFTPENTKAIAAAGLPGDILFKRTRTRIPHNKFIVKLAGGKPKRVWTGSVNFTSSGFCGQTNVGHVVSDDTVAGTYLKFWQELSGDPVHSQATESAIGLTPNPRNVLPPGSITPFYSPRVFDNMLSWYAARIDDAAALTLMTIPFDVAPAILTGLAEKRDCLRLVILEDPPSQQVLDAEKANAGALAFSNGAVLGKNFVKHKSSFGGATVTPIKSDVLEKWFWDEEQARPSNTGHVFFVHSKILVIDPLSDDPLVCSGSANFSTGSLVSNDENMLLIRGEKRVADIYFTEFDRIFRHFYSRDAINHFAQQGEESNALLLDETPAWIQPNYAPGTLKSRRLKVFFPDPGQPKLPAWSAAAAKDPDVFADEQARADKARKDRNAKAKQRRDDKAAGGAAARAKKPAAKGKAGKKQGAVAKKAPVKKPAAKKAAAKKAPARKTVAKKAAPKKGAAKKLAGARKR